MSITAATASSSHSLLLPASLFTFSPSRAASAKTTLKPLPRRSSTLSVTCEAATLPVLSFAGEKVGEALLDLKSAPPETARAVVHRAIITDQRNKRRGTASTLTRAEVRGGGRKPYPQKKTGNARLGSTRTPLRPGGGVIFGPKPKDWSVKINRKEKRLAISTAIASAADAAGVVCVEEFGGRFEEMPKPKTKEFLEAMKRWGLDPKEKVMFLVIDLAEKAELSSRNIGTLKMLTPRTLNLFDVLNSDRLVLTPDSVAYLNDRYGAGSKDDGEEEEEDGDEEYVEVEGGEGEGDEPADASATE